MSTNSNIEWTQATWNPVVGCTRASAGCDNCYAVTMTHRLEAMGQAKYTGLTVRNRKGDRHFNGVVRTVEAALTIPLRKKKPTTWFVNSMSDLFHKSVPFEFIDKVFAVMALTPHHTYQILTKRPGRMAEYLTTCDRETVVGRAAFPIADCNGIDWDWYWRKYECAHNLPEGIRRWPLRNVQLGTSCENQPTADERIPHLLRCPAAVRFLSLEPLLGGIRLDLGEWQSDDDPTDPNRTSRYVKRGIDWVIVGGESGPGARPCDVAWIRSIVKQCQAAGVPVFVKQLGGNLSGEDLKECSRASGTSMHHPKGGNPEEWPEDLRVRELPATGGVR